MPQLEISAPVKVPGDNTDNILGYLDNLRRELAFILSSLDEDNVLAASSVSAKNISTKDGKIKPEQLEMISADKISGGGLYLKDGMDIANENETFCVSDSEVTIRSLPEDDEHIEFSGDGLISYNSSGDKHGFALEDGALVLYKNGSVKAELYLSGNDLCIDGDLVINGEPY